MRGATILCYSTFGVYIYAVVARRAQGLWRWTALATGTVFVGCVVLGFVAVAEALADRAGAPSPALLTLFSTLLVGCGGLIMIVYILYTNVRPLWQLIREIKDLPQQREELRRLRDDIRDLSVRVSDQIIPLRSYADPVIVRRIKEASQRAGVSEEEARVAEEAARMITLRPENIHQLRQYDEQALIVREVAAQGAKEFAILAASNQYFYGDVMIVAALAMGAERLGVTLHREPQGWHRRLGALIAEVLATYEQPAETLAAYRKEKAASDAAKHELLTSMAQAGEVRA
jgi:hypothetical protein